MWELDHKEGWVLKNWCFWTVVLEKTVESPLDCKEIQPVSPKRNHPWIFIPRTDAESEALATWCKKPSHWKRPWCWEEWGKFFFTFLSTMVCLRILNKFSQILIYQWKLYTCITSHSCHRNTQNLSLAETDWQQQISFLNLWNWFYFSLFYLEKIHFFPLVAQSCPTLCDPMDYSLAGSSVHGDSPGKNTWENTCYEVTIHIHTLNIDR